MRKADQLLIDLDILEGLVQKHLGYSGKLLGSKTLYRAANPDNLIVFNSNICTATKKIWYGDFDITQSEQKLKDLAKIINQKIYVLYESDGRFENADKPLIDKFIYSTDGTTAQLKEEYKKNYNWELGRLQYNPTRLFHNKEFKCELKYPFLYKFVKDNKKDPIILFYKWIEKQLKLPRSKHLNCNAVYLLSEDYDELMTMCKIWAFKYMHISEARLDGEVGTLNLSYGPMAIYNNERPDWVRSGHVYINMEELCSAKK